MRLYFVEQALRFTNALREAEQRSGRKYFPLTILMSYFTLQNKDLATFLSKWVDRSEINLFIDSGAYSAFTHHQTINVNQYGKWLQNNLGWIDHYANLDVKESWQNSQANLQVLEGMGLKPLPVYHLGEPENIFTDMLLNYDYICLGGMVGGHSSNDKMKALVRKYSLMAEQAGKHLHLFGIGAFPILLNSPAFSADSSSYVGYRWGKIKIFDEVKFRYIQYPVGSPELIRYEHYFVRFGLPSFPAFMKRAGKFSSTYLRAFEYLNMKRAEEYLTAIWKVRGHNP